jgi:hypothetical protein
VGDEPRVANAGSGDTVPSWVRPVLYTFLAVFLLCGLLSVEVWPLTGWRLYHERRGEARSSWQIVAVDGDGGEATIHLDDLPLGWHNTSRLIGEFPGLTRGARDRVCAAWAAPLRAEGRQVAAVRVYRVRSTLRSDPPDRRRELAWTCARA